MINEFLEKRNEAFAQTVIKGLESRDMSGYYARNKEEALEIVMSLIPEGSKVTRGGSMTCKDLGVDDILINGNYDFFNRDALPTWEEKRKAELFAYDADVFLGSCNALTEDGILVNIDGNANRVSAIAYGPRKVVLICSLNKVCKDLDSAMKRARNVAAPANAQRFPISTPCKEKGTCFNCKCPDTICCQFLITRYSKHPGRIHVILLEEDYGF